MTKSIVKITFVTDHDFFVPVVEKNIVLPHIVRNRIYLRQKEDVESYDFNIPNTKYYGIRWRLKPGSPRMRKFRYRNVIYHVTYQL